MNPDPLVYGVIAVWVNLTAVDDFLTVPFNVTQMLPPSAVLFQVYSKSTFVLPAIKKGVFFLPG